MCVCAHARLFVCPRACVPVRVRLSLRSRMCVLRRCVHLLTVARRLGRPCTAAYCAETVPKVSDIVVELIQE